MDEKTTRTFSPVELVGTAVLVSYHMATRSDFQLLKAVKDLRRHLRIHFKDLRLNAQCWSSVWEFIRDLPKDVSVSPECKKSSRQTLGEEVQNEEDEDPWAPSPYLKAATQAGDIVGDFDKRTTRSQATRPGLNNRPEVCKLIGLQIVYSCSNLLNSAWVIADYINRKYRKLPRKATEISHQVLRRLQMILMWSNLPKKDQAKSSLISR